MADGTDTGAGYAPTLGERVARAAGEVAYLQKTGKNEAQGYKFLSEAKVKEALNPALRKHGLYVSSVTHNLGQMSFDYGEDKKPRAFAQITTTVVVSAVNLPGEAIIGSGVGFGYDKGGSADKAVYKAQAGALKYALTSLFLIATGDDPENDGSDDKPAPTAPKSGPSEADLVSNIKAAETLERLQALKPAVLDLQAVSKESFDRVVAVYREVQKGFKP